MLLNQAIFWNYKWQERTKHPVNHFAKKCYQHIKSKKVKTLLDLGCGLGNDAIYFAKKKINVTAVDFSKSGILNLQTKINDKKLKNIKAICQDIKKLRLKKNSFDVVYSNIGLQYFDDQTTDKIFANIHSLLKKNGLFFIKSKSTDDLLYGKGKRIAPDIYYRKNHLRHFFSYEYLKDKLKKFKILNLRKTSSVYYKYKSSYVEAIAQK